MAASLDDLVSMAVFARVVEHRSFTGAAGKLGLSKSAVSARVSQLEDRLGARLLHRTTRRVTPTEAGLAFYERCARVVAEADEATAAAAGMATEVMGVLRVSAPVAFTRLHLAPVLAELLERHRELRVELSVSDRYVDVVGEGFDMALRIGRGSGGDLVGRKLGSARPVVVGAPAYLARRGRPEAPGDLLAHDCLRYSLVRAEDEWRFRMESGEAHVPVAGRLSTNSGQLLREAAIEGVGLAVLPSFWVEDAIESGSLEVVLETFAPPAFDIRAVYPASRHVPAKVRALIDLLVARLRRG